ncbi:MAG: ATP-binding protein, partial [Bacteroidia bacterium]|nr:ATP-binding protein [Bacteroidia bacterium]
IARKLVLSGITQLTPEIIQFLQEPDAIDWIDNIYRVAMFRINVANIDLAARRTGKIVFALKYSSSSSSNSEATAIDLKLSLESAIAVFEAQSVFKRDLKLITSLQSCNILGFPEELVQVWINLISNAIQAMEYKGKLTIQMIPLEQSVVIEISDTGPGIPPELQTKIFEPFFTTKGQGEGSGLGLSVVKNIIEKHKGTITLHSVPGETTFRITLPI